MRVAYSIIGMVLAAGCSDSGPDDRSIPDDSGVATCAEGETLPDEFVGSFSLVLAGGGCPNFNRYEIGIDRCGRAVMYTDGRNARARVEGESLIVEDEGAVGIAGDEVRLFTLRDRGDLWHGDAVFQTRIDFEPNDGRFEYWAVRFADHPAPSAPVPEITVCATRETWSLHRDDGSGLGPALREGQTTFGDADWTEDSVSLPTAARMSSGGVFLVNDHRLPFCGRCEPAAFGDLAEWNGTSGVVRYRNSFGLCAELNGEVEIELNGTRMNIEHEWWVTDEDDVDGDGDLSERLVRRTRTELTPSRCLAARQQ